MTLYVNEVEGFWFTVNLATFVLTLFALWDAWVQAGVVKRLNGKAREIAAAGNLRREAIRLVVQTLLLTAVVPGLFTPGTAGWSVALVALLAIAPVLLVATIFDAIERRRLIGTVEKAMEGESARVLARIESKVDAAAVVVSDDHAAAAGALVAAERIEATVDDTAHKVQDIHDVTVERK